MDRKRQWIGRGIIRPITNLEDYEKKKEES